MANVNSIQLRTNELLTYHCGCHGSLVTIATKYVVVLIIYEAPCQIFSKYLSRSNRSLRGAKHRVDYSVHIR